MKYNKEDLGHLIYNLGHDRTKRSNEAFDELCKAVQITRDEESEKVFRKYKESGLHLEKTTDFFIQKAISRSLDPMYGGLMAEPPWSAMDDD